MLTKDIRIFNNENSGVRKSNDFIFPDERKICLMNKILEFERINDSIHPNP